ncbi:MAG TPA: HAD-IA family hydrolase [Gemmatimonadaceae bacterium]|nr:HAD-IA family hydrolase [Gemmatimonadaceae bacterium]
MTFDCEAILFDLDGVLVDSRECVENAWREWAQSHGLDPAAVLSEAHGHRTADTIRIVAPHLDAHAEAKLLEAAESTHTRGLREIPGVCDLIARLPEERWAVFTSGTHPVAELRLRFARIPFPSVFICAEDVRRGKPDPEGYRTAAERLGFAAADCVVFEDAPTGIAAARAAGASAVGVATTYDPAELHRAHAVVRRLADVTVATRDGRLHITVPDSALT